MSYNTQCNMRFLPIDIFIFISWCTINDLAQSTTPSPPTTAQITSSNACTDSTTCSVSNFCSFSSGLGSCNSCNNMVKSDKCFNLFTSRIQTKNVDCNELTTSTRNNFECMKSCANNTHAITVSIVNSYETVSVFDNLNQE